MLLWEKQTWGAGTCYICGMKRAMAYSQASAWHCWHCSTVWDVLAPGRPAPHQANPRFWEPPEAPFPTGSLAAGTLFCRVMPFNNMDAAHHIPVGLRARKQGWTHLVSYWTELPVHKSHYKLDHRHPSNKMRPICSSLPAETLTLCPI